MELRQSDLNDEVTVLAKSPQTKLSLYMGICQKKLHIGFSKYSKLKRVVLLVLMTFCVCVQ